VLKVLLLTELALMRRKMMMGWLMLRLRKMEMMTRMMVRILRECSERGSPEMGSFLWNL
jgi:hypothetical protein